MFKVDEPYPFIANIVKDECRAKELVYFPYEIRLSYSFIRLRYYEIRLSCYFLCALFVCSIIYINVCNVYIVEILFVCCCFSVRGEGCLVRSLGKVVC